MIKYYFLLITIVFPLITFSNPLTRQEIFIMNKLNVKIALENERPHVVPLNISPRTIIKTELLDFSESNIKSLPSWIRKFNNLRMLNFSNTGIGIESTIRNLVHGRSRDSIEVLDLSGARFEEEIGKIDYINNLRNLRKLNLSNISNYGTNYSFKRLCIKNLMYLNLEGNDLDDGMLGPFSNMRIYCMKHLKVLNLSNTDIKLSKITTNDLPKSLESLDITGNNDTYLNDSFGNIFALPNLVQLKVDRSVRIPKSLITSLSLNK